ncbi:12-oxophytodienoate reductase [Arthrobacter sp. KNU-44]|uniref:oxidoreductase n=1 Tax=Arthrobacter sp. KNU-44 TaxID=3450744 RepID=UPI003F44164C
MSSNTSEQGLFSPFDLGSLHLRNRFAMAPMTRKFSPGGVPTDDVAAYYARRAASGVGLIITEGTYIGHPTSGAVEGVPHFYGDDALNGWANVVDAVHAEGGQIIPQLWHVGADRGIEYPVDDIHLTVSPSGLALTGTPHGRAAKIEDLDEIIEAYAQAAATARRLGFDGIEIHAAHGYLIDEFLWAFTNRRTDRYGGDSRARARFASEVVAAARAAVGDDFTIVFRLSQWKIGNYGARTSESPDELAAILEPISQAGVDVFHASTRRFWVPPFDVSEWTFPKWVRELSGKPVIATGSIGLHREYDRESTVRRPTLDLKAAEAAFADGDFDLAGVGRALLANPDWVTRFEAGQSDAMKDYSREREDVLW